MNPDSAPIHAAQPAWYCLRSQPKHEHIGAARLREEGIEVFLPRIRFQRASKRGPVWFTEPLFPNYLFARFLWQESARLVRHAPGVSSIVAFGPTVPTVPDETIAELRAQVGDEELKVIESRFEPNEPVQITGGALHGLTAIVTQVFPPKERVRVLLEFLGQQTTLEVEASALLKQKSPREQIL
jgi:transcriptional antiterminator RfaH